MRMKISGYAGSFRIVSLALDEETKQDLLKDNLEFIFVADNQIIFYPDNIILSKEKEIIDKLYCCNNYDVFEFWQDGTLNRYFDNNSSENYFGVTGKCNSNCIMCPSPEFSRVNGTNVDVDTLIEIARHIPSNTPHLTITGGEPFLLRESIFEFIEFLKNKFHKTEFLFLTNGRIFALDKYVKLFQETMPDHTIVAIPFHGSTAEIHDAITQSKGSFDQTFIGVKKLLKARIKVEIRIVVSQMNVYDLLNLAKLITENFSQVEYVSVMAMEMTGSAYVNREKVWISYKNAGKLISEALLWMITHGVNVKLYNFPLCTVDQRFWSLCEKSISPDKVRFSDQCMNCRYLDSCGGVFAGTLKFEKDELEAIR